MTTGFDAGYAEFFGHLCGRLGLDASSLASPPMTGSGRHIVGVSEWTAMKLFELYYILDTLVSYAVNINMGRRRRGLRALEPFVALDLSAGAGAYPYRGMPLVGSPLMLLEALERRGLLYRLLLVERDMGVAGLLEQNVETAICTLAAHPLRTQIRRDDLTCVAPWAQQYARPWMPGVMVIDIN